MASLSVNHAEAPESCTPPNGYVYHQLRETKSEIRLLRKCSWGFEPSKFDRQYHLQTISISERPDFIAFSYTWGDPTPTEEIYCNGGVILVAESIARVLDRARVLGRVWIWIDSICINQADVHERGWQVQLMREIYISAKKVIAFVGDAPLEQARLLLNCIQRPFRGCETEEEFKARTDNIKRKKRKYKTMKSVEEVKAYARFLSQSWFTRIWIVQEVLLAREVDIWFGGVSFSMRNFYYFRHLPMSWYSGLLIKMFMEKDSLIYMDAAVSNADHVDSLLMGWPKRDKITGTSIGTLLQQFQGRGATDIRDRVYGLLGLASRRDREAIKPDYSEYNPPSKLFYAVASHIVHYDENPLQILYSAGPCYTEGSEKPAHLDRRLDRGQKVMENLENIFEGSNKPSKFQEPTWVPRWGYSARIHVSNPVFSPSGKTKAVIRLVDNPKACDVPLSENTDFLPKVLPVDLPLWKSWLEQNLPKALSVQGAIVGMLSAVASSALEDLPALIKDCHRSCLRDDVGFSRAYLDASLSNQDPLDCIIQTLVCDYLRDSDFSNKVGRAQLQKDLDTYICLRDPKRMPLWLKMDPDLKWKLTQRLYGRAHSRIAATLGKLSKIQKGREVGTLKTSGAVLFGSFPEEAVQGDVVVLFLGQACLLFLDP
jgi:hypothetical protein